MDTEFSHFTIVGENEKGEKIMTNSTNITNDNYIQLYPSISDKLIECLERDFPDKLPTKCITEYELGVLIGEQKVINKLKFEKEYIEKEATEEDEE